MPIYLVTYHGGPGLPSDPAAVQQMVSAFQTWVAEVGPAMRDPGAPLGPAKTVSAGSVTDGQTEATIGGYTLLETESLEEAARLLQTHPFVGRGAALQVSEAISLGS
jgi:hypothetical protein